MDVTNLDLIWNSYRFLGFIGLLFSEINLDPTVLFALGLGPLLLFLLLPFCLSRLVLVLLGFLNLYSVVL